MFKTFVVTSDANSAMTELTDLLDNRIERYSSLNHKKEIERSAPSLTTISANENGAKPLVCLAVTVTFAGNH